MQGLQPAPIIIGVDEVVEVCGQLGMAVVMVALDGGFLDRPVHPFDLSVGPGMLDLGQAMLDPIFLASHIEHMRHVSCGRAVRIAGAGR